MKSFSFKSLMPVNGEEQYTLQDITRLVLALLLCVTGLTVQAQTNLCVGATSQMTYSGSGGAWVSSNPSVATVGSGGLVTATSAGSTSVNYQTTSTTNTSLYWDFESGAFNFNPTFTSHPSLLTGFFASTGNATVENWVGPGYLPLQRQIPTTYCYIEFTTAGTTTVNSLSFTKYHNNGTAGNYSIDLQISISGGAWTTVGTAVSCNSGTTGSAHTVSVNTPISAGTHKIRWIRLSGSNGSDFFALNNVTLNCTSTSTNILNSNAITVNNPTFTTTPGAGCGTSTVTLGATATSGVLNWYAASSGGTSLGTGSSFVTPSISATTTYYADLTANGCTSSPRTAVVATINTLPAMASNVPSTLNVEILVVGGGGGGSARHGGGGGGGQVKTLSTSVSSGSSNTVTIGAGGTGGVAGITPSTSIVAPNTLAYGSYSGGHGGSSSFGSLLIAQGGGGGTVLTNGTGRSGGNSYSTNGTVNAGSAGSQGWDLNGSGTNWNGWAGGGGAGSNGNGGLTSPTGITSSNATAGNGGAGVSSSISGILTTYGGGGGGGCYALSTGSSGNGADGGGNGGKGAAGSNGLTNRGGGGGGSGFHTTNPIDFTAGSGGSGLVIVRYLGAPVATGGTITQAGGYTTHTFTTSATFTVGALSANANIPNVSACGASAVTFTGAVNAGFTLDWYDAASGGTLLSAGTANYTTPILSVTKIYYVAVRNTSTGCVSASRTAVTATISTAPTTSANQTICVGATPADIVLTNATGNIQWQSSTNNVSFSNISGQTSATLSAATIGALSQTNYYRAILTNSACAGNSPVCTITVNNPTFTTTPGTGCGTNSVTLGATSASGVLNWFAASSGGTSLGTGSSFVTPSISSSTTYYADLTANGCTSSPRTPVIATVNALPPTATNLAAGITIDVLTVAGGGGGGFARAGGGGAGGYIYSTNVSYTGGTSTSITVGTGGIGGSDAGGTGVHGTSGTNSSFGSTYIAIGGGGAGSYGGAAQNGYNGGSGGGGAGQASGTGWGGTATVGQGFSGGSSVTQGGGETAGGGGGGASTAGGNASGTSRPYTPGNGGNGIQNAISGTNVWYSGGGGGSGLANSGNLFGTNGNGGGSTSYGGGGRANSAMVINSFSNGQNGGPGIVIVRYSGTPQATGGTITQVGGNTIHTFTTNGTFALAGSASSAVVPNMTSCGASTVTFTGTVSSGLTLDWYSAATGGTVLASGTTSYTTPILSATTTYYVAVRNISTGCVSATRLAVTATINSSSTISSNQTLCVGSTPASDIVLTSASGTIQWQSSTDNVTFTNIVGQTTTTLSTATIGALSQTKYFRAVVTNGTCVVNSPVCTITVNNPTPATTPASGNMVWRGVTSSDWNTASNWYAYNGSVYSIATAVPTSTNKVIIPAYQTCVLAQPSINIVTAGVAKDVVIETGATLTMATGTLNVNGNFVKNGTFVPGSGTVVFNAAGTVSGGATSFNNVTLNNGVNFGSNLSTINGIFSINTNGWVSTNPPIYGSNSVLKYNTGGLYGRGAEWSTTSGGGYPNDVQVSNNTTLDVPNTSGSYTTNRALARDLTIDSGSNLYMDYGSGAASGSLTVGRDISISGNLSLGDAIGGDISIGRNWTHTSGTFSPNGRAVIFNGTGNQTMTAAGGENFAYTVINKPTGNVILANNVTISGGLTLTNGLLELGTNTLAMGSATLTGGSAISYVKTASTGTLSRVGATTAITFPVGNSAYNPAVLTNNGTSDIFSVRVIDNVTTNGTGVGTTSTLATVKRTWMISEATSGGSNASVRLYWNGTGEEINGFASAAAFVAHYSTAGSMWENMGGNLIGGAIQSIDPITSFSPFSISSTNAFAPLPVELLSFDAQCANQDIIVRWTTASEHNTLNFIIQGSEDGKMWNDVQTIEAAQNSNTVLDYAIQDIDAARGTKYYRLVQTDQDGVQKIYGPIMANCGSEALIFLTFPNPSTDEFTLLFGTQDIHGDVVMTVSDATGKVVRNAALFIEKGTTSMMVPSLNLSPGVYLIQLTGDNFQSAIIKHSLR